MSDQIGFTLRDGMQLAGVNLEQLWWRYAALGGSGSAQRLAGQLRGLIACEPREHDLIAQALNEAFLDQGAATFPVGYSGRRPARLSSPAGPPTSRSVQARQAAVAARVRSAAAARRSAALHASAAALMQASGQLQFARQARARASLAERRASVPSAA